MQNNSIVRKSFQNIYYNDISITIDTQTEYFNVSKLFKHHNKDFSRYFKSKEFVYQMYSILNVSDKIGFIYMINFDKSSPKNIKLGRTYFMKQRYTNDTKNKIIRKVKVQNMYATEQALLKHFRSKYKSYKAREFFEYNTSEIFNEMIADFDNIINNNSSSENITFKNNLIYELPKELYGENGGLYLHFKLLDFIIKHL